ncbi:MAG: hypothetical protein ACW964_01515 [Candidatus Hodarchaeales archaeon]|jgi:hypothetical protein
MILNSFILINISANLIEENVEVFQVTQNGSFILISLNYNFNKAPTRVNDESLVVFLLCSLADSDGNTDAVGGIMFFHTDDGQSYYFSTIMDPFNSATTWIQGTENVNYVYDGNDLSLLPLEIINCVKEPDINVIAKIFTISQINPASYEFQEILGVFQQESKENFKFRESTSSITDTTSIISTDDSSLPTSEPSITSGFELYLMLSVFVFLFAHRIKERNKDI